MRDAFNDGQDVHRYASLMFGVEPDDITDEAPPGQGH